MMKKLSEHNNLIFTCAVVGLLLLMVLPLPTFLLISSSLSISHSQ